MHVYELKFSHSILIYKNDNLRKKNPKALKLVILNDGLIIFQINQIEKKYIIRIPIY